MELSSHFLGSDFPKVFFLYNTWVRDPNKKLREKKNKTPKYKTKPSKTNHKQENGYDHFSHIQKNSKFWKIVNYYPL